MEFCKVMEERYRMCDTITCENCRLHDEAKKLSERYDCDCILKYHPQKAEEIIMKWSCEHYPRPIYPTIGEVVSKICTLMNIDPRTSINTLYDERLTKEVADYFGIAPINENTLKSKV